MGTASLLCVPEGDLRQAQGSRKSVEVSFQSTFYPAPPVKGMPADPAMLL
jgi:hypothetical protein